MITSTDLEKAIMAATNFIKEKYSADGLWHDFYTLAGTSSDWVTGFISYAIAHSNRPNGQVMRALKTLLFRQRPNGGWSYNETVPTDCDSTAWVLMALSTAPTWRPSAIQRAIQYIKYHQHDQSGGFSTYSIRDGIDRFMGVSDRHLISGWVTVHPCVTGVVIQSLLAHGETTQNELVKAAVEYLLQERNASGIWRSYWWKGYAYSTYHALRALSMARVMSMQEANQTSRFLLLEQQENGGWSDGSSKESETFATSFALLSLLLFPSAETLAAAQKGTAWLLQYQCHDGGWPTVPILRIPPPMVNSPENVETWRINQEGTGVIIEDQERLFTSAAALWALSVFRSMTT
jgi:squalene cyclase